MTNNQMPIGTVVEFDHKTGEYIAMRPFSRSERLARRVGGWMIRMGRWLVDRTERRPAGIFTGSEVITNGYVTIQMGQIAVSGEGEDEDE